MQSLRKVNDLNVSVIMDGPFHCCRYYENKTSQNKTSLFPISRILSLGPVIPIRLGLRLYFIAI